MDPLQKREFGLTPGEPHGLERKAPPVLHGHTDKLGALKNYLPFGSRVTVPTGLEERVIANLYAFYNSTIERCEEVFEEVMEGQVGTHDLALLKEEEERFKGIIAGLSDSQRLGANAMIVHVKSSLDQAFALLRLKDEHQRLVHAYEDYRDAVYQGDPLLAVSGLEEVSRVAQRLAPQLAQTPTNYQSFIADELKRVWHVVEDWNDLLASKLSEDLRNIAEGYDGHLADFSRTAAAQHAVNLHEHLQMLENQLLAMTRQLSTTRTNWENEGINNIQSLLEGCLKDLAKIRKDLAADYAKPLLRLQPLPYTTLSLSKPLGLMQRAFTWLTSPEKWSKETKGAVHSGLLAMQVSAGLLDTVDKIDNRSKTIAHMRQRADELQKQAYSAIPKAALQSIENETRTLGELLRWEGTLRESKSVALMQHLEKKHPEGSEKVRSFLESAPSHSCTPDEISQLMDLYQGQRQCQEWSRTVHVSATDAVTSQANKLTGTLMPVFDYLSSVGQVVSSFVSNYLNPSSYRPKLEKLSQSLYQELQSRDRSVAEQKQRLAVSDQVILEGVGRALQQGEGAIRQLMKLGVSSPESILQFVEYANDVKQTCRLVDALELSVEGDLQTIRTLSFLKMHRHELERVMENIKNQKNSPSVRLVEGIQRSLDALHRSESRIHESWNSPSSPLAKEAEVLIQALEGSQNVPIEGLASQLLDYQKQLSFPAQLFDLVLAARYAGTEETAKGWIHFLLKVERAIHKGKVTDEQVEHLRTLVTSLLQTDQLSTWLTVVLPTQQEEIPSLVSLFGRTAAKDLPFGLEMFAVEPSAATEMKKLENLKPFEKEVLELSRLLSLIRRQPDVIEDVAVKRRLYRLSFILKEQASKDPSGQMRLFVNPLLAEALSLSGHTVNAPVGSGFDEVDRMLARTSSAITREALHVFRDLRLSDNVNRLCPRDFRDYDDFLSVRYSIGDKSAHSVTFQSKLASDEMALSVELLGGDLEMLSTLFKNSDLPAVANPAIFADDWRVLLTWSINEPHQIIPILTDVTEKLFSPRPSDEVKRVLDNPGVTDLLLYRYPRLAWKLNRLLMDYFSAKEKSEKQLMDEIVTLDEVPSFMIELGKRMLERVINGDAHFTEKLIASMLKMDRNPYLSQVLDNSDFIDVLIKKQIPLNESAKFLWLYVGRIDGLEERLLNDQSIYQKEMLASMLWGIRQNRDGSWEHLAKCIPMGRAAMKFIELLHTHFIPDLEALPEQPVELYPEINLFISLIDRFPLDQQMSVVFDLEKDLLHQHCDATVMGMYLHAFRNMRVANQSPTHEMAERLFRLMDLLDKKLKIDPELLEIAIKLGLPISKVVDLAWDKELRQALPFYQVFARQPMEQLTQLSSYQLTTLIRSYFELAEEPPAGCLLHLVTALIQVDPDHGLSEVIRGTNENGLGEIAKILREGPLTLFVESLIHDAKTMTDDRRIEIREAYIREAVDRMSSLEAHRFVSLMDDLHVFPSSIHYFYERFLVAATRGGEWEIPLPLAMKERIFSYVEREEKFDDFYFMRYCLRLGYPIKGFAKLSPEQLGTLILTRQILMSFDPLWIFDEFRLLRAMMELYPSYPAEKLLRNLSYLDPKHNHFKDLRKFVEGLIQDEDLMSRSEIARALRERFRL